MNTLKTMVAIERAELLTRIMSESLYVTEKDKDVALHWIRELLEPLKGQTHKPQESFEK